MEAYSLWQKEYPDIKIGKSKFAALRPPHVLLTSELPRNVCVCRYHENFILLWVLYIDLIDNCWCNKCEICKDGVLFKEKYPLTLDLDSDQKTYLDGELREENFIRWFQWEKIVGLNGKGGMEKIHKTGLPSELYNSLFEMLPTFNWHHFIKGKQAAHYNYMKVHLSDKLNIAMMQIVFSGNFNTTWQDEIQSAHWSKTQVTILTAVYWHDDTSRSAIIVSDDIAYTKDSSLSFLTT
ncbi:hypothetical protein LOD99_8529 [Oopsacas minuta]|uniref:Uncharacterized protein n=1 Tax=Oopsacas minuta TaxID=111878 RepID=A0AAV7JH67_9METZ|nr:hypothetical protein LOD99_8529 [Oopsacas minuta]